MICFVLWDIFSKPYEFDCKERPPLQRETLDIIFTIIYLVLLLWQIVRLIRLIRKGKGREHRRAYLFLMAVEVVCAVFAGAFSVYFDSLPGYGFMPGLTWLYLWLISFAMIFVYLLMLIITAIVCLVRTR